MLAPQQFGYHRAVAPMLWVLVAIGAVELTVVHLLVAHWSQAVALVLSALTLAGMAWLVVAIRSMGRLPVLLDAERLVMPAGLLKRVEVPTAEVAGLLETWDGGTIRARDTLNLALVAYPNVVVALRRPLPGRRAIVRIAHRLDDPAGFTRALNALVRTGD